MDKVYFLSQIIEEYQKVISNLKSSVDRYKHESDMDEDNTHDPDDYARQTEAKDMQLRFQKMLNKAKQTLSFLENSKSENKEKVESGAIVETDKNILFIGVSVPIFMFQGKEVISFSEDAPVFSKIKNKKIGEQIELANNIFKIIAIH